MLKKLFLLFFFFISLNIPSQASPANKIKIVTSFYPMYIMAKNVARDVPDVSVENLTPSFTGCLHDYALTSNDVKKITDADIFVANGAGMESFLDKVIAQNPDLKITRLSEGVSLLKEQVAEENPHVWVSISNAIIEVKNLGRALVEFDPVNRRLYEENTLKYVSKLETLQKKMLFELAPYKGRKAITFHEAFPYFAREFGFEIAAVIVREPGSEPSAKEMAETITLIKKNNIPVLFSEPQYPDTAARIIAKETGAKIYILDPAVTGPDDYDAYINIMENNLKILKEAFSKVTPRAYRLSPGA